MFKKEANKILTKEESEFVRNFARTFSVREAADAAGFDRKTAFARSSRLLEKDEVRCEIMRLAFEEEKGRGAEAKSSFTREDERILREYEKIAFADTADGEIKVSDKLRALEHYRALMDRMKGNDGDDLSLVVNYDYGE